ncbi:MAG TPA: hypothetical protein VHT53_09550, partial [Candidatus Elarobacter sp.]|nr:hypothetical protein [Candidatus Elarobacter sp.]
MAVKDRVIFTTTPLICPGSEYVNDGVLAGTPDKAVGWKPGIKPGYSSIAEEQRAVRAWLASE